MTKRMTGTREAWLAARLEPLEAEKELTMGATTTEIKSSHVPCISHPEAVARLIERAAGAAVK